MLIMASLQLVPGVFALFYHYTLGKSSTQKASHLTLFFILGAETISACLFLSVFYLSNILFFNFSRPEHSIFAWIAVGVLIALSLVSFFLYFRRGPGTRLFIPRQIADALDFSARTTKSRSDAFVLGAFSGTYEIIFTLPLYIITSIEIMEMSLSHFSGNVLTIVYILIPIVPLLIVRWRYQCGSHLADIMHTRTRDKHFTRFILGFSYLVIAILIICFRINTP